MSLPPIVSAERVADLDAPVFLDARPGEEGERSHRELRLAGARHAELERDLSRPGDPARGGRHPLPPIEDWAATLGRWGITPDATVVIYDGAGGGHAAARAWWMLRAVGHPSVAVLDGGLEAAREAGLATESGPLGPVAAAPPYPVRGWQAQRVEAEDVERARRDPAWRVLDVRARERFRGEEEPFDPVAGRIPGAVNLPWEQSLDSVGRLRSASELEKALDEVLGDTPPTRTIVHCGSGVTACHTLLVMEQLGRRGAALYVGSWSEWCLGDRPRAGGEGGV